jgi:hypothetical protein
MVSDRVLFFSSFAIEYLRVYTRLHLHLNNIQDMILAETMETVRCLDVVYQAINNKKKSSIRVNCLHLYLNGFNLLDSYWT